MTTTTSLELSRELYELLGWDDTERYSIYEDCDLPEGKIAEYNIGYSGPLYDLGYLLRKLPTTRVKLRNFTNGWTAQWDDHKGTELQGEDATPEDAVAKLAIELAKAGVLKREEPQS